MNAEVFSTLSGEWWLGVIPSSADPALLDQGTYAIQPIMKTCKGEDAPHNPRVSAFPEAAGQLPGQRGQASVAF